MRSPIERMIDAACGFDPDAPASKALFVTLRCPACGTEKKTCRDRTDPPAATTVLFPCPECPRDDGLECRYLDDGGNEVLAA